MLTVLPLPQASTAPHREVFSEPLVPPVEETEPSSGVGKRRHPAPPALWVILWDLLILSHPMRTARESAVLNHWDSDCGGKEGRVLQ